ncbi:MAG: hypothetical protein Q8R16_01100 [bacterium]|nr:hypothetical protein [bacterium]
MSEGITVGGARADAYRSYRDLRGDFDRSIVPTYRATLLRSPERMDAQTIAIVLHGNVGFAPEARAVLKPVLEDDDVAVPFDQLRPLLRAEESARAVIAACEPACPVALADALVLLFISANAKSVIVEAPDQLPTEAGDADDSTDAPDKPPTGYGG